MTYAVALTSETTSGGTTAVSAPMAAAANTPKLPMQRIPLFVPSDQVYYWSHAWQDSQKRSETQLAAGECVEFDSARDLVRWLLSDD
jgi:hypothetical protein